MNRIMWITATCLVCLAAHVLSEVPVTTSNNTTGSYEDFCQQGLIQLKGVNETGQISFDSETADRKPTPCVLKIESCPTCQIIIEPASFKNFDFFCQTGVPRLKHQCSLGCDYLYMFDVYYMNETMHVIQSWNQTMKPFHSESSSVYIVLCHGPTSYQFSFRYRTIKKYRAIHGSTYYASSGTIQSPFFPVGYHQNFETYEFLFSSSRKGEYITLAFDDWNLDSSSAFYFEESNINGPVYGSNSRPNVISNRNTMKVLFNTGQPILSSEQRGNMGFKAVYNFISNRDQFRNSKTSCRGAGYLLDSVGGEIEFSKDTQPTEYFDCIWVVKTQPGYNGVYLKLMKKKLPRDDINVYGGRNQIQILAGVTSNGHLLSTMYNYVNSSDYKAHVTAVGFYVRINSTISPSDLVILAYASFKNTYSSNCKHDSSMFTCNNGRCIDKQLVCDGYDHCGDNYDETHGCSYGDASDLYDTGYQYTITIGVIVPMVISVFLIMVICLLFVMIRRCRRARLREAGATDRLQTLSEDVSARRGRRRRRRRRFFGSLEVDAPPTYDEAIQNPPGWYDNVAFGPSVDPTLPQPPSYSEAVESQPTPGVRPVPPGSPSSSDSSQSDQTSRNENPVSSSSSSEGGSPWEIGRRQTRNRQRTEASHLSSSDSEVDEVQSQPNEEFRNPNINPSVVGGHRDISTSLSNSSEQRRKDFQKAHKYHHKGNNNKDSDKNAWKNGPGPSNCVIPDANKVRSSHSMELLPTMSLTSNSTDIEMEPEEPHKGNKLRTGSSQSPMNRSCPSLSGNLTAYLESDDTASAPLNSRNTYPPQLEHEQNNKSDLRNRPNTSNEIPAVALGCDNSNENSRVDGVVKRDCDGNQARGDVMVVYDRPNIASPNTSPFRTPAYLMSDALANRETHHRGRSPGNQTSDYHGNSENLDATSHRPSKNLESVQNYRKRSDRNSIQPETQHRQQNLDSNQNHGYNTHSRLGDRRLAHLPILNQMRRSGDNSTAMQNNDRNRQGRKEIYSTTDGGNNSEHDSRTFRTDNSGDNRHTSRPYESGHQRSHGENSHHGNRSHGVRQGPTAQGQIGSHGNNNRVRTADNNYISPSHRVNSNSATSNGGLPTVAIATGQVNVGAIVDRGDSENPADPQSEDNARYLNLYRMGGDDDIYV